MYFDEEFWVALSIVLFFVLIFKRIKNFLSNFFIDKAKSIEHKINEASLLRHEAEGLLEEYSALYKNYTEASEKVLLNAKQEINYMRQKAEKELLAKLTFKKNSALEQINYNEEILLRELRLKSLQLAISISLKALHEKNFNKINSALIKTSIEKIAPLSI